MLVNKSMHKAVGQLARTTLLMLHWAMLEAYIQANMFQHIRPDVLDFNLPALLNQLVVLVCAPVTLYLLDGIRWSGRAVQTLSGYKTGWQSSQDTSTSDLDTEGVPQQVPTPNKQADSVDSSARFPSSDLANVILVAFSGAIVPLCNVPVLEDDPTLRLTLCSIGILSAPLHLRAICKKEVFHLDVPLSIAASMSIRWANYTAGVLHQTLAGSLMLSVVTLTSHVVEAALRYLATQQGPTDPAGGRKVNSELRRLEAGDQGLVDLKVWSIQRRPEPTAPDCSSGSSCLRSWKLVVCCLSIGTLTWITLWIGLSPAMLSRWSDVVHCFQVNCLLVWFSALGCVLAAFLPYKRRGLNFTPFLLLALWITGLTLQFRSNSWRSLMGSCFLTFTLPLQWMYLLNFFSRLRLPLASNRALLSACISLTGTAFLGFYIMGVFTDIVLLTTKFWRRMPLLFTHAVVLASLPILIDVTCDVCTLIKAWRSGEPARKASFRQSGDCSQTGCGKVGIALGMLIAFMMCVSIYGIHLEVDPSTDSYKGFTKPTFRVVTFNVFAGKSLRERTNLFATSKLVAKYDPDILGFQEAYAIPPFLSGVDFTHYIAADNRMHAQYGVNPLTHGGGDIAILTRSPFFCDTAESYPALDNVVVFNYGISQVKIPLEATEPGSPPRILSVICTHFVYENASNNAGYLLKPQVDYLASVLRNTSDPIVLLGDLNLLPSDSRLDFLFKEANMTSAFQGDRRSNFKEQNTVSIADEVGPIDHIFYRGLKLSEPAKVLKETGFHSDHYPVTAQFYRN